MNEDLGILLVLILILLVTVVSIIIKENSTVPVVTHYKLKETTDEVTCSTHPDAPHGFDRTGSHSTGRYVCDCEGWEPDTIEETSQDE